MGFLREKIAIVTGGGSGIGKELALALGAEGACVVVTDIVQERVEEVVDRLRQMGVKAGGYRVDHADLEETQAFAERFAREWNRVDVLCCNAGVGHGAKIQDITLEEWKWVLDVNLWGVIYMIHLFVPGMIQRRAGSILITASAAALMPAPAMAPYNVTKGALLSLAETLRMELATYSIGVTALCPGIINTNIIRDGKVHFDTKPNIIDFYTNRGADPALVARDALRALKHDIGVMPTPLHAWPLYLLRRFSPALYHRIGRYQWKKGWALFVRLQDKG